MTTMTYEVRNLRGASVHTFSTRAAAVETILDTYPTARRVAREGFSPYPGATRVRETWGVGEWFAIDLVEVLA